MKENRTTRQKIEIKKNMLDVYIDLMNRLEMDKEYYYKICEASGTYLDENGKERTKYENVEKAFNELPEENQNRIKAIDEVIEQIIKLTQ